MKSRVQSTSAETLPASDLGWGLAFHAPDFTFTPRRMAGGILDPLAMLRNAYGNVPVMRQRLFREIDLRRDDSQKLCPEPPFGSNSIKICLSSKLVVCSNPLEGLNFAS